MDRRIFVRLPVNFSTAGLDKDHLKSKYFETSLYFASKELYRKLISGSYDMKEYLSFYKYFLRSKHRSTPFGLYSAVSVISFGDTNQINEILPSMFKKYLRIDASIYHNLLGKLLELDEIKSKLVYFTNPSIFFSGGSYKYLRRNDDFNKYLFEEVDGFSELQFVIDNCKDGKSFHVIVSLIKNEYKKSINDVIDFINKLIYSEV